MNRITKLVCIATLGCAGLMLSLSARAAVTDQDKQFLAKISQGGFNEIKLSELAETKSTNPQVKAFAHKMVVEHNALATQMKPFADAWGLTPPTSLDADHQAEYDKLNGLSGMDFDKEYMNIMEKDHHDALNLFNEEAKTTTDAKFKVAVMHGQSVVAAHTHMADDLGAKLGS
jgi:putative membrane protein